MIYVEDAYIVKKKSIQMLIIVILGSETWVVFPLLFFLIYISEFSSFSFSPIMAIVALLLFFPKTRTKIRTKHLLIKLKHLLRKMKFISPHPEKPQSFWSSFSMHHHFFFFTYSPILSTFYFLLLLLLYFILFKKHL